MLTPCKRAITLAAALVCSSLVATPTSGDKIKRSVPISATAWTVDLRKYGDTDPREFGQLARLWTFRTSELFLSTGELMATFETHDTVAGLQKRDDPHRQFPYNLHAVVFDSASGRMLRQASWGSERWFTGLIPRDDGSFAVFLGDRLDVYGADLTPRSEVKLPSIPDADNILHFSASPSGRTMLIQYTNAQHSCVWIRNDLPPQTEENCEAPPGSEVSDQELVMRTDPEISSSELAAGTEGGYDPDAEVRIKTFQGTWRILCRGQNFHCGIPYFISNDLIMLKALDLVVVRSDQKTVFWVPRVSSCGTGVFFYASKAHLLAAPSCDHNRMTSADVYDLLTRKRVFQVKNEGHDSFYRLGGLAVSDDGRYLALLGEGILRAYALPPKTE